MNRRDELLKAIQAVLAKKVPSGYDGNNSNEKSGEASTKTPTKKIRK